MSAPKLLDRLRAKQAERLAADVVAREYSATPPVPPADGLQRRGDFIMPTRETMPAYAAHFEAKADTMSTPDATARQIDATKRDSEPDATGEVLALLKSENPICNHSARPFRAWRRSAKPQPIKATGI
jgi:hypothetical protein